MVGERGRRKRELCAARRAASVQIHVGRRQPRLGGCHITDIPQMERTRPARHRIVLRVDDRRTACRLVRCGERDAVRALHRHADVEITPGIGMLYAQPDDALGRAEVDRARAADDEGLVAARAGVVEDDCRRMDAVAHLQVGVQRDGGLLLGVDHAQAEHLRLLVDGEIAVHVHHVRRVAESRRVKVRGGEEARVRAVGEEVQVVQRVGALALRHQPRLHEAVHERRRLRHLDERARAKRLTVLGLVGAVDLSDLGVVAERNAQTRRTRREREGRAGTRRNGRRRRAGRRHARHVAQVTAGEVHRPRRQHRLVRPRAVGVHRAGLNIHQAEIRRVGIQVGPPGAISRRGLQQKRIRPRAGNGRGGLACQNAVVGHLDVRVRARHRQSARGQRGSHAGIA